MRLFARAIRRSGLDVTYSEGYNPRLYLCLVLPRPVGVASRDDLLVLETSDKCRPEELRSRLDVHLPNGIKISKCFELSPERTPKAIASVYSLQLSREQAAGLVDKISDVLRAGQLLIQRLGKQDSDNRQLDIRPYLSEMKLDGAELSYSLANTDSGSAKPAEILALLNLDNSYNRAQLVREKTKYIGSTANAAAE